MYGPRLVRKIIVIDGQLWEMMPQTFLWRESSCTLKTLFSNPNVMLPKDGVINSLASQTSCWKWEWPHYCLLLASLITPLGHLGRAILFDGQIQVLPISATWQQPPLMHGGSKWPESCNSTDSSWMSIFRHLKKVIDNYFYSDLRVSFDARATHVTKRQFLLL